MEFLKFEMSEIFEMVKRSIDFGRLWQPVAVLCTGNQWQHCHWLPVQSAATGNQWQALVASCRFTGCQVQEAWRGNATACGYVYTYIYIIYIAYRLYIYSFILVSSQLKLNKTNNFIF